MMKRTHAAYEKRQWKHHRATSRAAFALSALLATGCDTSVRTVGAASGPDASTGGATNSGGATGSGGTIGGECLHNSECKDPSKPVCIYTTCSVTCLEDR